MPQELRGDLHGPGLRIAIVAARFNEVITKQLLAGALETLTRCGVRDPDITIAWVPGSFELPVVARAFAKSGRCDAVICLGAVIRGETTHYDLVAAQAQSGAGAIAIETGIPTIFGVLTTENLEQAINRSGGKSGNIGANAALAAIETASVIAAVTTA